MKLKAKYLVFLNLQFFFFYLHVTNIISYNEVNFYIYLNLLNKWMNKKISAGQYKGRSFWNNFRIKKKKIFLTAKCFNNEKCNTWIKCLTTGARKTNKPFLLA